MTVPNKLTVLRIILVPVFFISYLISKLQAPFAGTLSAVLMLLSYAVAELSDLLDGKIARKYNLVTDLGKVMDPFADTLAHLTFFACFMDSGLMPLWAFIIIVWREFTQNFMRMLMMGRGKAMPANIWGKAKTCLYAFTSVLSILYIVIAEFARPGAWNGACENVLYVFYSLSAVAAFLSFLTYFTGIIKSGALSGMTR